MPGKLLAQGPEKGGRFILLSTGPFDSPVASDRNHMPQGDPAKLAQVMIDLASARPLPLGRDTLAVIEARNAFVAGELQQWRSVALSTDFPAGA